MFTALVRLVRPAQWFKNFLVFVPLIASHQWTDFRLVFNCILGFIVLSLAASSLYIFNDLSDLEFDRKIASKAKRPLVTGQVSVSAAIILSLVLLLISTWGSLQLGREFSAVVSLYIILTLLYTTWLKKIVILDIITLASLLTLRIFAGSAVTSIQISDWLIAFALFVFLSLAVLKRTSELMETRAAKLDEIPGRSYILSDQTILIAMGMASTFSAVVILCLYINSAEVKHLYRNVNHLWLLAPLFLYWLMMLWMDGLRGKVKSDPVTYAAKKPASYLVFLLVLVTVLWSI